jgi:thiosulfate dehydrogenase
MRVAIIPLLVVGFSLFALACSNSSNPPVQAAAASGTAGNSPSQQRRLIHQGKLLFDQTPKEAPDYVGNKLSCSDCHIQSGTAAHAAPMTDLAGTFPQFSKRAGHIISLQDRIQECFVRSEAGQPLPASGPQMAAMVAYINSLSKDQVNGKPYPGRGLIKLPTLIGNPTRGKAVYVSQCAACHGIDGAGAPPILPALWGNDSYNNGAGMNNPAKMAAFVAYTMPQDQPGSLTPQQAYDVSAYIHSMPRPKLNKAYKAY